MNEPVQPADQLHRPKTATGCPCCLEPIESNPAGEERTARIVHPFSDQTTVDCAAESVLSCFSDTPDCRTRRVPFQEVGILQ